MKKFTIGLIASLVIALGITPEIVQAQQPCSALYTWTASNPGPGGTTVSFYDSSFTMGVITGYSWSFGDGSMSTLVNPVHTYTSPGNYLACLTITGFVQNQLCTSTYCDTITISGNPVCNPAFTYSVSQQNVIFTPATTNNASYLWTFGDGDTSTLTFPSHYYTAPGTYQVCLSIFTMGMTCNSCQSIVITGPPPGCQAGFTYTLDPATGLFTFNNTSSAPPNSNYFWQFGDGTTSTAQNPQHSYTAPGIYYACLTISNSGAGCQSTFCDSVYVNFQPGCNANFAWNGSGGNVINFTNQSTGTYTSQIWSFGDGSTSTVSNPAHTYPGPGTYTVCLSIFDSLTSCFDSTCQSITVGGGPCQASFYYYPDTVNGGIQFVNTSTPQGNYTYSWSFGDGTGSSSQNPNHLYSGPGPYIACLTIIAVNTGCQSTYCDTVYNTNLCVPVFTWMEDSLNPGTGTVIVTVTNPCGGTYTWSFGDGSSGTGTSVIHQYATSGWFWVCVTVNQQGTTYTYCDSVYSNRVLGIGTAGENLFELSVMPNPADDFITISMVLEKEVILRFELLNITGQNMLGTYDVFIGSGRQSLDINLNTLVAGLYLLKTTVDNEVIYKKVVIQ
jgi:PKD repeat protein